MDAITFFVPSKPVQWHRADQSTILCKACAGKGKMGQGLRCPKCKGRGFFTPRHQPKVDKNYQKLLIHVLPRAAHAAAVLGHFQSGDRDAAGVGGLARSVEDLGVKEDIDRLGR